MSKFKIKPKLSLELMFYFLIFAKNLILTMKFDNGLKR